MQRKPELSVEILNVIVHSKKTCPEKMEIFRPIPFFNILLLQFVSPSHPNKGHFPPISPLENFRYSVFIIPVHPQMKTQTVPGFILVRVEFISTTGTSLYTDVVK